MLLKVEFAIQPETVGLPLLEADKGFGQAYQEMLPAVCVPSEEKTPEVRVAEFPIVPPPVSAGGVVTVICRGVVTVTEEDQAE